MRTRDDAPLPGDPEPRWSALIAVLAVGGLSLALPEALTVGPTWLFPAVVVALLVPTVLTHRTGHHRLNTLCGFAVAGVLTVGLLGSLLLLIAALPAHTEPPVALLRSAAALWVTNVLVFALWYWRLDAGGPHHRERRVGHPEGAFVFPQMTLAPESREMLDFLPFVKSDFYFLPAHLSTCQKRSLSRVIQRAIT